MEDNVALDTNKQKQFVKSIKGIKKLLKKNEKEGSETTVTLKTKQGKITKRKRKDRGLVYLSHIPHGFYEHEMTQYFKQFGVVTNARVIRSRHTGNSKGYAFVEFSQPAVAEIVAETMNNYLMGKRLIKAAYIPPEKQRQSALRKNWSTTFNPGREKMLKMKKAYNANKDRDGELKRVKKLLSNIAKTKKKLSELGIEYDFTPVDYPEAFKKFSQVKVEETTAQVKEKKKTKKTNKKGQNVEDNKEKNKVEIKEKVIVKEFKKQQIRKNKNEEVQKVLEVNKKEQKQRDKKLKETGVKILKYEDDLNSGESEDDNDEEDDESISEGTDDESDAESEVEVPPKKAKSKPLPKIAKPVQEKKQNNPKAKKISKPMPKEIKSKVPEKVAVSLKNGKKPKLEKRSPKKINKQFKKKK